MDFSIKRINALIKKETIDLVKNINVAFMVVVPIAFCFLYSAILKQDLDFKIYNFKLCTSVNMILFSMLGISMLVAEEKENKTISILINTGISPFEFLLGKSIVILLFSMVTNIILYFILGFRIGSIVTFSITAALFDIIMIELGIVIGFLSKNQVSTCTLGSIILFPFLVLPILARCSSVFRIINKFCPSGNFETAINKILYNDVLSMDFAFSILGILIWIILCGILLIYVYSRKKLSE